jgi:predicted heme/steroid binding protein
MVKPGTAPGFAFSNQHLRVGSILKEFTLSELARFSGRDGAPIYIAFKDLVYDLSSSYHWRDGNHWSLHDAGADLTTEIADAPHTEEMLARFPVVGRLKPGSFRKK